MYHSLWRNGDEFPEPYTFNTTSLDDIRNFLAWEIVDSITSGDENLKVSNSLSYNLNEIDWDQYDSSLIEVADSIKEVHSTFIDDKLANYKTFDTSFYSNPELKNQQFYNVRVSDQFTLVLSEHSFDPENCYRENLEHNEFMFGQRPWI
jgi:hypothetical protein